MPFNKINFENALCELCQSKHKNSNGLSRHITRGHKISLLEYFVKFGGKVLHCECGKQQNWKFAEMRFSGYCSRTCAMRQIRSAGRDDMVYRANIAEAMRIVWSKRTPEEIRRIVFAPAKSAMVIDSSTRYEPERVMRNLDREFKTYGSAW